MDNSKITVDLSHVVDRQASLYPGTPPVEIIEIANHSSHGYVEHSLKLTTHTGTHVDAPFHIIPGAAKLVEFSVDSFIGKGTCISLDHHGPDVQKLEKLFEKHPDLDFVLFETGWSKFWQKDEYLSNFPVLHPEVCQYLAQTFIKGVGVDCISVDTLDDDELINHHILMKSNKLIFENLTNLSALLNKSFTFIALPIHIPDAEAAPCRAMAQF